MTFRDELLEDQRKFRAAVLRLVAVVERELLAPIYRFLGIRWMVDALLERAAANEDEAEELDPEAAS